LKDEIYSEDKEDDLKSSEGFDEEKLNKLLIVLD
jgi:hypothetical protein